jgi:hypothetical protein
MKVIITESKMTGIIHKLLNISFSGFDDIDYDWADFNCGMGVCCDPNAVGFVLPESDYDDYLFKLVDSENYEPNGDYPEELKGELPEVCYERPNIKDPRFDLIIFYDVFSEELVNYLGPTSEWSMELLTLLNDKFDINAKSILFI